MNFLLKVMLNGVGENSIIIGRGCPIEAFVVFGVTATTSNLELESKQILDFICVAQKAKQIAVFVK